MTYAILERHAPAIIPMPTRAELDHIVGEINKTASRLHEVRRLQAEASFETRAALRTGAAVAASAGYIDSSAFLTGYTTLEQLAYVAGVADTIEAVNMALQPSLSNGTVEQIAGAVNAADRCTNPLKLGQLLERPRADVIAHPDLTPAQALLLDLAACRLSQ